MSADSYDVEMLFGDGGQLTAVIIYELDPETKIVIDIYDYIEYEEATAVNQQVARSGQ